MKKPGLLLVLFTMLLLSFAAPAFGQSQNEAQIKALAYIQNTDLADLFSQKDKDSPYELNLPEMVYKNLTEMAIYEALYQKVGIDLQEEVKAGNLYVKDMYYINFKEKKIEKEIIKSQKKLYGMNIKEVSLKEALQVDELNLGGYELTDINDLKFLLNINTIYLENNPKIINYRILRYCVNLTKIFLDDNNIKDISFLNIFNKDITVLSLANNNICNIYPLIRFKQLGVLNLSNNNINSLEAIKDNENSFNYLYINGNPIDLKKFNVLKNLCYEGKIKRLKIDRKIFKEYGDYFGLYPEYLQWIDYIYFVEDDGSVTEWHVITD